MNTLPGIIQQRWAAVCEAPSLTRWRSLAVWLDDFADACAGEVETQHMAEPLRALADEAWQNMLALQPEREAA